MKIRSVVVKLFHVDRQIDRRDEANSHFLQLCKHVSKMAIITFLE